MKTTIQLILWLVCSVSALAQTFPHVVPGGLANTEGNSSMTEPFTSSSFRMQTVIAASEFAFLGGGTGLITSIAFRVDGASANGAVYGYGGGLMQVSTTTRGPDSLSPVFAENVGSDVRTIWSNGFGIPGFNSPGSNPQPFFEVVPTFFLYSPSMGNLLLDITAGGTVVASPGGLDAHNVTGDSVSRVYAFSEEASTGIVDTRGLVTRFDITVVPEPGAGSLFLAAMFLAVLVRLFG